MLSRFVLPVCLAAVVVAAAASGQQRRSALPPFRGLYPVDGVTTSNDEFSIWLSWLPERFRIVYPNRAGPFDQDSGVSRRLHAVLGVSCRADGRPQGFAGPTALQAQLLLPMHPAAPDVYSVLHPMYWLLGLFGHEFERIPVVVDLAGVALVETHMVRRRLAYGRRRPDLVVDLPGPVVLRRFVAGSPMTVAVSGDGVDVEVWFPVAVDLVEPARQMSAHCRLSPAR